MKNINSLPLSVSAFAILLLGLAASFPLPLPPQLSGCFSWQAVIRDGFGIPIDNRVMNFEIAIIQDDGSATGNGITVYEESHQDTTNQFGLVTLQIGCGELLSGDMANVDWGIADYWLSIQGNPEGGTLISLGKSRILGVPWSSWAEHSGDWVNSGDSILYHINSRIGIGTEEPERKLHIQGDGGISDDIIFESNSETGEAGLIFYRSKGSPDHKSSITNNSRLGFVSFRGYDGTLMRSAAEIDGYAASDFSTAAATWNGFLRFKTRSNGVLREHIRITADGNMGIGTASPKTKLDVIGTTRTKILEITGGSDLTEGFQVRATEALLPAPGLLVSIDPDHPGELTVTTEPYDKKLAGIISGANGVQPGMKMGQKGTIADGDYPVALTGRVYVQADASFGAIQPGDFLTSSSIPGYAMKVKDQNRAQGAVIGKAMTELFEGQGYILVLVSLQ